MYERFTNAFVLERATSSTLTFAIDDPPPSTGRSSDINKLIVDIYNKGKSGTCNKGSKVLLSMPLISTNYTIIQRRGKCTHNVIVTHCILLLQGNI